MTAIRRSEPIPRAYIERLLLGAAPERQRDISMLWANYDPTFHIAADGPGARLSANSARIVFDHKTMAVYWLLSYACWRVLECYSPAVLASLPPAVLANALGIDLQLLTAAFPSRMTIAEVLGNDLGLAEVEARLSSDIYAAQSILRATELLDESWPSDIPLPDVDRSTLSAEADRATFDLACISTAYAFCHEIRHVLFAKDGNAPSARPEEELACDVWAHEFLTAKLGDYSTTNGFEFKEVLAKRSMAAAVGIFVLYETTDRWGDSGTEEYPPIADRMDATMRDTNLAINDNSWVFYASVLVAILRRRNATLEFNASNAKELCELLVEQIRRTS